MTTDNDSALSYTTVHFAAALAIAIFAGGLAFFLLGLVLSYTFGGMEAIQGSTDSVFASLIFSIVLVGLFGGIPAIVVGAIMLSFRWFSLVAFIVAGMFTASLAPLLVMALTPLGVSGWMVLMIAVPSGAFAALAAHYYLEHYTRMLGEERHA